MDLEISFGNWLRGYRRAMDLNQDQFAQKVGYALSTVEKMERGKLRPSAKGAKHIAEVLKFPLELHDAFVRWARGFAPLGFNPMVLMPNAPVQSSPITTQVLHQ